MYKSSSLIETLIPVKAFKKHNVSLMTSFIHINDNNSVLFQDVSIAIHTVKVRTA